MVSRLLAMKSARQLALIDVTQRKPEPLPLDAHDDQAEASPGVEPTMEQRQLRRGGWELEEAEVGV
jgi:hypothetical protein